MIDMVPSGANDGVEQKGGIIYDSLGIGYESRICKARPDFLSILHRLIAPALLGSAAMKSEYFYVLTKRGCAYIAAHK
jgi:hypothetical protein